MSRRKPKHDELVREIKALVAQANTAASWRYSDDMDMYCVEKGNISLARSHVVIRRPQFVAGTSTRPEVGVFTQAHGGWGTSELDLMLSRCQA